MKANRKNSPIIGITTYGQNSNGRFDLPVEYVEAVRAAGGLPVLLAPGETHTAEIFAVIDGLILAGGGDIDPAVYGGKNHPSIERVDALRDRLELGMAQESLQRETPVLGICRGQQILNLATGGDLIEHLPDLYGSLVIHRLDDGSECEHPVQLELNSRLAKITGLTELPTVSKHHQGVGKVSAEWEITARAADGVIEAQDHKRHPWMIGVQWHPEMSYQDSRHLKLFQAFVEAAAEYKNHRNTGGKGY